MPNVALSEHGRIEATALAQRLAQERITAIITSPMQRCRETAVLVAAAAGQHPIISEGWNEVDFGAWTGQSFDALEGDPTWRDWNAERDTATTSAGVSMPWIQKNVLAEIQRVQDQHGGGRIVIVSHAELIKAVLSFYLGIPLTAYMRFDIDPACFSTLALWCGGGKIMSLNQASW